MPSRATVYSHQRSTTITTVLARRLPWCRRDLLTATGETAHRSVSTSDSWFVRAESVGVVDDLRYEKGLVAGEGFEFYLANVLNLVTV